MPKNFPVKICPILHEFLHLPTEVTTMLDVLKKLIKRMRKRVPLSHKERQHMNIVTLDTDIQCLILLQRHCKRKIDSLPETIRTEVDTTIQLLANTEYSETYMFNARYHALVMGSACGGKLYCKLCAVVVDGAHFISCHTYLQLPEEVSTDDVGPGLFFVDEHGIMYYDPYKVLRVLIQFVSHVSCASCVRERIQLVSPIDFNAHLLQHFPQILVGPEGNKTKVKIKSIEDLVSYHIKQKKSEFNLSDFLSKRDIKTSTSMLLEVEANNLLLEQAKERYEIDRLFRMARRPDKQQQILEGILHMVMEENDGLPRRLKRAVLTIALRAHEKKRTHGAPIIILEEADF